MKIAAILFATCSFVAATPIRSQDVRLMLNIQNDGMVATILNGSPEAVKVNRVFTNNPAFGVLQLHIRSGNKDFGLLVPPNEDMATESAYVILQPFNIVGQYFPLKEIQASYGLKSACYSLFATYHDVAADQFNAMKATLVSNRIRFCL
jgi:hypothetical protein